MAKLNPSISPLTEPVPHGLAPPASRAVNDIRVTNALPPAPGLPPNLMETIVAQTVGVNIEIDMWKDTFPTPGTNPDELQVSVNGVPYGNRIQFPKPLEDLTWPYKTNIKGDDVANHGEYRLSYEIFLGPGGNEPSGTTLVNVDTVGPAGGLLLDAITLLAGAADGKVTLSSLAANGDQLTCRAPGRLIARPLDSLHIYKTYTDADPIKVITNLPVDTLPVEFSLTKDEVVVGGTRLDRMAFRYFDYSKNSTIYPPKLREIEYILTPQPENLSDPAVPAAPLDLRDAQLKLAEVHIFGYDNFRSGQIVQIELDSALGSQVFPHTLLTEPTPADPAKIEIPWLVLVAIYGVTGPGTASLRYRVVEGGNASAWSNTITVAADFSSAAGRPDDPGPVRDYLPLVTVTSSEGLTNKIGPGDTGNATAEFNVYTGAVAGHKLQFYWDGIPIYPAPRTVTQTDIDSGKFTVIVTAAVIAQGANGLGKKVWYSLTNGVNSNVDTSLATLVDVLASELQNVTAPEFPKSVNAGGGIRSISCKQFVELGIDTSIVDTVNLKQGDTIRRFWTLYGEGLTSTNKLVEAEILPPIVVANDHSLPGGGEYFLVDFATYVQPAILGRVEFYYTILKADGVTQGKSPTTVLYVSRRNADNSVCGALPATP
ncbi:MULTISPECIES: hypothetical protein [Pseudomonas]|uniref:hypothetical protein n=1 Tax=Pseudomonas TaxID=286 RepID=UPI0008122D6B|nr:MULTISPECIES: hypothetical protein [Pseudomonas]RZI23396.1 hypothetical protein EUX53_12585 [Pseudomonas orientalis]CRM02528.1 hypothetical protein [Pseudomonas sp. 28 E 9]